MKIDLLEILLNNFTIQTISSNEMEKLALELGSPRTREQLLQEIKDAKLKSKLNKNIK